MIDVSVIVVSYNTAELTCAAIASVYEQTRMVSFEVLVVDNASTDGSSDAIAERFPNVRLISLNYNAGFAAANNIAAQTALGRYILLLNPDTVVLDGAIDTIAAFAEANPEYGIYGGSTFFGDMRRNPTAGWNKPTIWSLLCTAVGLSSLFRSSRLFASESLAWWDWSSPREVGIVTGCFLLATRDFWNELGGFDERFHMYGEDADLSFRAAAAGRPCIIVPEAAIIHYGGASEKVRADKMVRLLKAKVQLFRKHWDGFRQAYALRMLRVWVGSRALVTTKTGKSTWSVVKLRTDEWLNPSPGHPSIQSP